VVSAADHLRSLISVFYTGYKRNFIAFSPQATCTDKSTAAYRQLMLNLQVEGIV
jgi:hypothetical protein